MPTTHNSINYIEFPLRDADRTKAFYENTFDWRFTDWGDGYISFEGAGIDGGFNGASGVQPANPGALIVLYSNDLEGTLAAVEQAGGEITQPIYGFPGGRRFHFHDPNGNELAVWSEDPAKL